MRGSHIRFERNPEWWGREPYFERIVVRTIENTVALEANLLSETVDFIAGELGLPIDQAIAFEERHGDRFVVEYKPGLIYEHLTPSFDNPILHDPRVRRALLTGLDREAISERLFGGRQPVAATNVNPLDWIHSGATRKYSHDPAAAAALLDEAGWTPGDDGIRRNGAGEPLRLELMTTAGDRTRELVEQVIQSQWRALGVDVRIRNEPPRVFFGDTVARRKFTGFAMFAWISSPEGSPRGVLHSEEIPRPENGWSGNNVAGYMNPEADRLTDAIEVELDRERPPRPLGGAPVPLRRGPPRPPPLLPGQCLHPAEVAGRGAPDRAPVLEHPLDRGVAPRPGRGVVRPSADQPPGSLTGARSFLRVPRRFFSSRRLAFAPADGRVGTRGRGSGRASSTRAARRARAASRLRDWVRWVSAKTTISPAAVSRLPARRSRRSRRPPRIPAASRSSRPSTAVDTLLTFCPPGPDARTNLKVSAASGTAMPPRSIDAMGPHPPAGHRPANRDDVRAARAGRHPGPKPLSDGSRPRCRIAVLCYCRAVGSRRPLRALRPASVGNLRRARRGRPPPAENVAPAVGNVFMTAPPTAPASPSHPDERTP